MRDTLFMLVINAIAVAMQIAVIAMGIGIWLNYVFIVLCGSFVVYAAIRLARDRHVA